MLSLRAVTAQPVRASPPFFPLCNRQRYVRGARGSRSVRSGLRSRTAPPAGSTAVLQAPAPPARTHAQRHVERPSPRVPAVRCGSAVRCGNEGGRGGRRAPLCCVNQIESRTRNGRRESRSGTPPGLGGYGNGDRGGERLGISMGNCKGVGELLILAVYGDGDRASGVTLPLCPLVFAKVAM